ncbi:Cys-tRNA(Pro)/Cys-tRNA(Cys) deacylase [Anaerovirgula multivorans]|uniref:Cys-tRNA(Pro)/Cys-tRNA(Cys) deacylase n=1 Tax=Anaerovirgula multivorans TaxID=312168 RepID=A0A239B6A8_9FIRM|nr:Cys-tRNA(Pro) deacylase [Anaerovirgula multivorans]SNS03427.1 Cys-tRNA(Pro)/Cys-tRNA(Cys) deacylase [Anaerovirgula multivorans]
MKKTNAARILDKYKIIYELREYEVDKTDLSAENAALKVGIPLEQVFKTLVARGDKTGVIIACVPGGAELNLKKAASISGNKKVELVPLKEVQQLTGYIRGGVSPIGMKKNYPTYIDSSALQFPNIMISAGVRGCQILINPNDLLKVVAGTIGEFTDID